MRGALQVTLGDNVGMPKIQIFFHHYGECLELVLGSERLLICQESAKGLSGGGSFTLGSETENLPLILL